MKTSRGRSLAMGIAALLFSVALLLGLTNFLQTRWSHRHPRFTPETAQMDLTPLLEKAHLDQADYRLLLHQTGLSPDAVDALLEQGDAGKQTILEIQDGFFHAPEPQCVPLIGGRFTCQDLLRDEQDQPIYGVPLSPLQPGDILLSFSTHTLGWRHGHAGLVIDPARAAVLEAVQLGVNSYLVHARHWQTYSNFMVLRVKDATAQQRRQVADFANHTLKDVPYSLLSGLTGAKDQPIEEGPGVHCAYLPWYAWNQAEVDLDANGGPIVTVGDLARSPELEVVQVFGMDPGLVEHRQSGL